MSAPLLAIVTSLVLVGCEGGPLAPRPGLPEYRELATVVLPGPARLDVAGGNLMVSRTDLDLDTQLGLFSVGAVWNSAARRWTWSFDDISFANGSFVDATGETHEVGSLAPGAAIAGTIWVKVSQAGQSGPNRLKTKGGLEYTFTTSGRPLSIRWASSGDPQLKFTQTLRGDGELHTSSIEQCIGAPTTCHPVFTIDYDPAGRVREVVDRAGRRALFTYDAAGNLVTARDGLDVATDRPGYRYEYSGGNLTAITNSEGERVEYAYDGNRRLVRATQIGAGDPVRSFVYRGKNGSTPYRTIATDPLGAATHYSYDGSYQLLAVSDPQVGETTRFTWRFRRVTSRTAPNGATTYWAYSNDDVTFRIDPSGNLTNYSYQPDGVDRVLPGARPLLRRSDRLGTLEERRYDVGGRLLSVTNGAGETLSLEYGPDQMISGFVDPAGISTSLSGYGEHGHATSVSRAGKSQAFAFDAVGNLIEGPNSTSASGPGHGGIVSRRFDEDRNATVIALSGLVWVPFEGSTMQIVYRSDRQPLLVARPGGGDDQFLYDELGRLERRRERADGVWHDTTFAYDAAGRVTAVDRANGMGQLWIYDALGRVKYHVVRDGPTTQNASLSTWRDGLLASFHDSRSGSELYSYDGAGRLSAIEYGNRDRAVVSWNLRSQRVGVALERGDGSLLRTISIAYDSAGRERGVYDNGVPMIERTWSAGRLSRTEYGNGLVRDFLFDPELGTLAGSVTTEGSLTTESTVVQMAAPDCLSVAVRCVSSRTEIGGPDPMMTSEVNHMMPNAIGSPSGQRVGYGSIERESLHKVYAYDAISNLTSDTARNLGYNEERNRLQAIERNAVETMRYEYDAAGFVTSRGSVPLTWDGAGRLTSYGNATFEWDSVGRPVASTIDGVRTTRRFGGLVEADAAGHPTAIDLGEVRIDLTGNGARYRHFDYRGNVKLVTDEGGDVVRHYEYSAYAVEAVYGDDTDDRSFARGQSVGDLVLIGHRLYDPAAARFLAPDPIFQLINQYSYTLGNPVQFWDPSGLQGVSNDQTAGAMMQGAGSALVGIGGALLGVGLATAVPPNPVSAALVGAGLNVIVLGGGLVGIGVLLDAGGGGASGFGGGFGAGPGLSAPSGFNENVGPPPGPGGCGGDACVPGPNGGGGGLGELSALAGLGGPSAPGGGGGGGCAPISLAEGGLPKGSLGSLLLGNLAVASIAWRRAGRNRPAFEGN